MEAKLAERALGETSAPSQKKIKRPPNSFMIFACGHRTELVASCNKPGADLLTTMTEFAEQTSVHPAQIQTCCFQKAGKPKKKAAKVPPAVTPVKEWIASLGLAPDGDWGAVKSVSNNIISKMLARKWSWVNLAQPQLAQSYVDAQRRAKTAHALQHPGYKYAPVQKKIMKKTKRSAFKRNQQRARGTIKSILVPPINFNPTTPLYNKNGAAEPPATTADAGAAAAAQAQDQALAQDQTQQQQAQAQAVFRGVFVGAADGAWAIIDPEPVSPGPVESSCSMRGLLEVGRESCQQSVPRDARARANGGAGSYNQGAESYCNMGGLFEVGGYPDATANHLPTLLPECSLDDEAILRELGSIDDDLPDFGVPDSIEDLSDDFGDSGIFEPGTFKL